MATSSAYFLAGYNVAAQPVSAKSKGKQKASQPVPLSFCKVQGRKRQLACAVASSGVHITDLEDQTSLSSTTSTAGSVYTSNIQALSLEGEQRRRRIFVGCRSAVGPSLACYEEQESTDGSTVDQTTAHHLGVSSEIQSLCWYSLPEQQDPLLIVTTADDLIMLLSPAADLKEQTVEELALASISATDSPVKAESSRLFVYDAIIHQIALYRSERDLHARMRSFDVTTSAETYHMQLSKTINITDQALIDVIVTPDRTIVALCSNGSLQLYSLANDGSPSRTVRLAESLSFASAAPTSLQVYGPSSILVAAQTSVSDSDRAQAVFLVLDLRHDAVLEAYTHPLPSSSHSDDQSTPEAVTVHTALLSDATLVFAFTKQSSVAQRVAILAQPFHMARTPLLADLVGKQTLSRQWLHQSHTRSKDVQPLLHPNTSEHKRAYLQACYDSRQAFVASVDELFVQSPSQVYSDFLELFEAWVRGEQERIEQYRREHPASKKAAKMAVAIPLAFVRRITSQLFASLANNIPAPVETFCTFLLKHKALTNDTAPEGLLQLFVSCRAWSLAQFALKQLPDLSESGVIACLAQVAAASSSAAVQEDKPALAAFLRTTISLKLTSGLLRPAIKAAFTSDTILPVLACLQQWLVAPEPFFTDKKRDTRLQNTIAFTQDVLDALFVPMLQNQQAHVALRALSDCIEDQLVLSSELKILRAPLEVFIRTEALNKREAELARNAKKSPSDQVALRSRNQLEQLERARHQHELQTKQYTLEEFEM
ncbi:uncharacterized protein L969DRAFT_17569 [Mixia osmundae IAM 14324]|uniref:Uncharacterized protein n=1 Tax=Mixia osmundae (strain CBS 9802 / IAM 14324 / JCM 22182 / KY 12970) TaxID=764103 RepID=G7DVQ7_MIXOS|nr:uncharacterized protein L969DRAFT_17569 [Mixia osmundae IAM 14324]KEI39651.1 hypothetical protein L969DRAFT_17569 [Mixia osmundae IAM 14324]GAA94667.1 hypothetical protein E5Q_01320 [Mixia osmundae IAM 14324]